MLDLDTRTAILRLHREGHGNKQIAKTLGVSKNAVKRVLRSGIAEVPKLERTSKLDADIDHVRGLYVECKGNLIRVAEELATRHGSKIGYSTLTSFCRRHGIGQEKKQAVGQYHFEPGEEMQHDTSPHRVKIADKERLLQCASLVLCFSRMLFAHLFVRFRRFECRLFLQAAVQSFGGATSRCMIDNTSVILAHGTGRDAVPTPQMQAFSKRFGFDFIAHEVGDANRSARVERPFHFIENNFYPGRTFSSLDDLNAQLKDWCVRVNDRPKRTLGASPRTLFTLEQPALKPLPIHIPEIYDVHPRRVDVEGYVSVHTNRYSVPVQLIGRRIEVRESADSIRIFDGHELVATHRCLEPGAGQKVTLDEHRDRGRKKKNRTPHPEEQTLRAQNEVLSELIDRLKKRRGHPKKALKRLHKLFLDYPTDALVKAVSDALAHNLLDLGRIEQMVLKTVAGDFFRLDPNQGDDDEEG